MQHRRNKRAILAVSYLLAAVLALGWLAWTEHARAERWERTASNGYQRAFGQLVTAVGEVDSALQKSLYATDSGMTGAVCAELFGKALCAQAVVSALPFSSQELEKTDGFLSRVGDYAYCLSRGAMRGQALTDEEREALRALSDTASVLAMNLYELEAGLQDGSLSLTELKQTGATLSRTEGGESPAWAGDQLSLIEREFPEVPSLIYDGPFSEHLTGRAPRALEGLSEIDEETARRTAAELLGLPRSRVYSTGELGGEIPCWGRAADDVNGATVYLSLTKQGGQLLSLLSSRPAGPASVPAEEAEAAAKRFLAAAGFPENREPSYHMTRDGVCTFNFAWRQGGVLCYSDLVKVSVALDNGRVCGFEAKGYLMAHCERELPGIEVDAETARAAVPAELELLAEQLALVPSDGEYETLCHEFKCADAQGRHCILYVNALTGGQEKILLLIEDESGTLTL